MPKKSNDKAEPVEVLAPDKDVAKDDPKILLQYLQNYSERPDLVLDSIEKHDPGFIKKLNAIVLKEETVSNAKRFRFGQIQAYVSLFIQFVAAVTCLAVLVILAINGNMGLGALIGMGIIYAITQGGRTGFIKIIDQIAGILRNKNKD